MASDEALLADRLVVAGNNQPGVGSTQFTPPARRAEVLHQLTALHPEHDLQCWLPPANQGKEAMTVPRRSLASLLAVAFNCGAVARLGTTRLSQQDVLG